MVSPEGAVATGNTEIVSVTDGGEQYVMLFYPDVANEQLQKNNQSAWFYRVPQSVHIAKSPDTNDYRFHLNHFVGKRNPETHVVEGEEVLAGGILGITVTTTPPAGVVERAQQELTRRLQENEPKDKYWRLFGAQAAKPQFGVAEISAANISMSDLTFDDQKSVLDAAGGGAGGLSPDAGSGVEGGGTGGGGGGPPPEGGDTGGGSNPPPEGGGPSPPPEGGPTGGGTDSGGAGGGASPPPEGGGGGSGGTVAGGPGTGLVLLDDRSMHDSTPIAMRDLRHENSSRFPGGWYVKLDGQGPASTTGGTNALTALLSSSVTGVLWQAFHGINAPVAINYSMDIPLWSTVTELTIRGNWERMRKHFSTAGSGGNFWLRGDIEYEVERMVMNGTLEVEMKVDGTRPDAAEREKQLRENMSAIRKVFMEQANKVIFEPAPVDVKPAEARKPRSILGLINVGGGFALKRSVASTELNLEYTERTRIRYNKSETIGATMDGFFEEIKNDPDAERKYFSTFYLDDWDSLVSTFVHPVCNWPNPSQQWRGEPAGLLTVDAGYPRTDGSIRWTPHYFTPSDDDTWKIAATQKKEEHVDDPPEGWTPDKMFIRRKISYQEPKHIDEYTKLFIERNVVELDEGVNGSLMSGNVEIRVDNAGKLEIEDMRLNKRLQSENEVVEVEIKPLGETHDGHERSVTRFRWTQENQNRSRYLGIYTGDPDYVPEYQYRVKVYVLGTLFSEGMEWEGQWTDVGGNGPLMVRVPTMDQADGRPRTLSTDEVESVSRRFGLVEGPSGESEPPTVEPVETEELEPRDVEAEPAEPYSVSGWSPFEQEGSVRYDDPPTVELVIEDEEDEAMFSAGWSPFEEERKE